MARPKIPRWVGQPPRHVSFKPAGVPQHELQQVSISLDELEAIRLVDLQGLYQEAAAEEMNVSRQTLGRILSDARCKIADALVHGKVLLLAGGEVCKRPMREFECTKCGHSWQLQFGGGPPQVCPSCGNSHIRRMF